MSAMVWSFILSRTLVPTHGEIHAAPARAHTDMHGATVRCRRRAIRWSASSAVSSAASSGSAHAYRELLDDWRCATAACSSTCFVAFIVGSFALAPFSDAISSRRSTAARSCCTCAPASARASRRPRAFSTEIEKVDPPDRSRRTSWRRWSTTSACPISGINMTYNNTRHHRRAGRRNPDRPERGSSADRGLRRARCARSCRDASPASTFSFLPADIVSQILNFGAPAPIEVQIRGPNSPTNFAYAEAAARGSGMFPALVDARIQQSLSAPELQRRRRPHARPICRHDRAGRHQQHGRQSRRHRARCSRPSGSIPTTACNYSIVMQTPQYQVDSLNALQNLPITAPRRAVADARRHRRHQAQQRCRRSIRNTTSSRRSRSTAPRKAAISAPSRPTCRRSSDETAKDAPKTAQSRMLGQVETMNSAFAGLIFGLLAAVVLIYLLIVVNFQSWADPFVIITALPAALAGIVWMLFATGTTLSVPALTGAIMCMGVATANSVLVISFAKEQLDEHGDAVAAAIEAGFVRLRPVVDDGARHDHRHAADGARPGRRRRAERAARPRGRRRPVFRNRRNSGICAGGLQHHPSTPRLARHPRRSENRMPPDLTPPPGRRDAGFTSPAFRSRSSLWSLWCSALPAARSPTPSSRNGPRIRRSRSSPWRRPTCAAKPRPSPSRPARSLYRRRRSMPASAAT